MKYTELTDESRAALKQQGFVAVVVQVCGIGYGAKAGQITSRHRTVRAANKRRDSNQRVEEL
jgi:hypothetical protein